MSRRSVYFAGNDTFKQHVIPLFGEAGLEETLHRQDAHIIYVTYAGHFGPLKHLRPWLSSKTLVFHWIGSDVLRWQAGLRSKNPIKRLYYHLWRTLYLRKYHRGKLISLAVTPALQEKLKGIAIPTEVFPITSVNEETIAMAEEERGKREKRKVKGEERKEKGEGKEKREKRKEKNEERKVKGEGSWKPGGETDVVGYVPWGDFGFYGGPLFVEVARRLPHRHFTMVVPDKKEISADELFMSGSSIGREAQGQKGFNEEGSERFPENVRVLPELSFEEMQRVLASAKCMLRPTRHDGLALMVLEALLAELQVIWSQPFPHTHPVDPMTIKPEELATLVEDIIRKNRKNKEGKQYVMDTYSVDTLQKKFNALFHG